jgi:hypothetical protein
MPEGGVDKTIPANSLLFFFRMQITVHDFIHVSRYVRSCLESYSALISIEFDSLRLLNREICIQEIYWWKESFQS